MLPQSHADRARKACEKITKAALPGTHRDLTRAIEREARAYREQAEALRFTTATTDDDGSPAEPVDDIDAHDLGEVEADDVDALDEARSRS